MLRTALQVSGLARALGDMKLRLEEKAEEATAQVKGLAIRIAIAAGLVLAALIFVVLALIAGLVALYAYLYPIYGVIPALGIVGGLMLAIAVLCAIIAMLIARRKSAKRAAAQVVSTDDDEDERLYQRRRDRREYRSADARAASEVTESIVSLAGAVGRSHRRRGNGRSNGHDVTEDAIALLQSGDRRTMMAVLGAVTAVGWLLGRTMPHSTRH